MDDVIHRFDALQLHETHKQMSSDIRSLREDNLRLRTHVRQLNDALQYMERLLRMVEERKQKIPTWIS